MATTAFFNHIVAQTTNDCMWQIRFLAACKILKLHVTKIEFYTKFTKNMETRFKNKKKYQKYRPEPNFPRKYWKTFIIYRIRFRIHETDL